MNKGTAMGLVFMLGGVAVLALNAGKPKDAAAVPLFFVFSIDPRGKLTGPGRGLPQAEAMAEVERLMGVPGWQTIQLKDARGRVVNEWDSRVAGLADPEGKLNR